MRRIRVIPILLLHQNGLVKSVKFKDYKYIGDPINAVRIFNDKEVDELAILDISATAEGRKPDPGRIREIVSEAFMPVAYGGGISTVNEVETIIKTGVEKVVLNYNAALHPSLVREAAAAIGSQSITVSMDVKSDFWGRKRVYIKNAQQKTEFEPLEYAQRMEEAGAGELLVNSIERDGTFSGFDIDLIQSIASKVGVPVIAAGGAGSLADFRAAVQTGNASAVAAGSMFVFQRPHRAVLISYPSQTELKTHLFSHL